MSKSHYQRKKVGHGDRHQEGVNIGAVKSFEEIRRACDARLRKSGINPSIPEWKYNR